RTQFIFISSSLLERGDPTTASGAMWNRRGPPIWKRENALGPSPAAITEPAGALVLSPAALTEPAGALVLSPPPLTEPAGALVLAAATSTRPATFQVSSGAFAGGRPRCPAGEIDRPVRLDAS